MREGGSGGKEGGVELGEEGGDGGSQVLKRGGGRGVEDRGDGAKG